MRLFPVNQPRPQTVDQALATLDSALTDLKHVSTRQSEEHAHHSALAESHAAAAAAARDEAARAEVVHANISKLLGR